jgi:hypothetical protein
LLRFDFTPSNFADLAVSVSFPLGLKLEYIADSTRGANAAERLPVQQRGETASLLSGCTAAN